MTLEGACESWRPLLYIKKKKHFSSACTDVLEKIFNFFFQKCKILIFRFFQHIHLEVVLLTSKYKKWIFCIILSISCPGNFFHRTFSFFSKRAWKSSKSHFFKKSNCEDFQALLEKKLKVLWKTFPGQEMLRIIQKIHFLYLEVGKTTSRWIFCRKSKN